MSLSSLPRPLEVIRRRPPLTAELARRFTSAPLPDPGGTVVDLLTTHMSVLIDDPSVPAIETAVYRAPRILEQLMTSNTWPVYSPFAKEHYGRGKKEGRKEGRKEGQAAGKAEAILLVLEARGVNVNEAQRAQITGCTNLRQLKRWVQLAVTVEKASDLFA
jgi:hypothetical protein